MGNKRNNRDKNPSDVVCIVPSLRLLEAERGRYAFMKPADSAPNGGGASGSVKRIDSLEDLGGVKITSGAQPKKKLEETAIFSKDEMALTANAYCLTDFDISWIQTVTDRIAEGIRFLGIEGTNTMGLEARMANGFLIGRGVVRGNPEGVIALNEKFNLAQGAHKSGMYRNRVLLAACFPHEILVYNNQFDPELSKRFEDIERVCRNVAKANPYRAASNYTLVVEPVIKEVV